MHEFSNDARKAIFTDRDFLVDASQNSHAHPLIIGFSRNDDNAGHVDGTWADKESAVPCAMKAVWPVLGSGEQDELPLTVYAGYYEVDHWFMIPAVLLVFQGGQGLKEPEGEGGSVPASEGQKPPGGVFEGGDEDIVPVPHGGTNVEMVIAPDLVLERKVLPRKRLKVEMIRRRCAATRAIVDETEMRRKFMSQRHGVGETRPDGLGAVMLMADDHVLIKDWGDVAQDEIPVSVSDTPFLRVEALRAQKAGPFPD